MIKTAVILAAGKGERIANIFPDKPKGFLVFGGKKLIERSVDLLLETGIDKIVLVAGYLEEYYHAMVEDYPSIEVISNLEYSNKGSLYSLYLAKESIKEPFFLLESDIIYEKRALSALHDFRGANAVLTSGNSGGTDEAFVSAKNGRIDGISKDPSILKNICGEMVGILKLSLEFYEFFIRKTEKIFSDQGYDYNYDQGLDAVFSQSIVEVCKVEDLIWGEIDDEKQYLRILNEIWPRIETKG